MNTLLEDIKKAQEERFNSDEAKMARMIDGILSNNKNINEAIDNYMAEEREDYSLQQKIDIAQDLDIFLLLFLKRFKEGSTERVILSAAAQRIEQHIKNLKKDEILPVAPLGDGWKIALDAGYITEDYLPVAPDKNGPIPTKAAQVLLAYCIGKKNHWKENYTHYYFGKAWGLLEMPQNKEHLSKVHRESTLPPYIEIAKTFGFDISPLPDKQYNDRYLNLKPLFD